MTACPTGWHLPSYEEWETLKTSISGDTHGTLIKSNSGWRSNNGDNSIGFNALPAGIIAPSGTFFLFEDHADF